MSKSLKEKAISGGIWNGVERFGSSFFLFISNLVLARLLSPEDFGCIGMLMVFISLSDAIVDGGFGSALIQKKEPTNKDYSTIFIWNILLSIILYIILYFASKPIALFYEIDILEDILKVQGLILVFNALSLIQKIILTKQILFKKLAYINLTTVVLGTIAGIVAVYCGFGVWSLVIKSLATGVLQCFLYWFTNKWRPQLIFSWTSFKELFRFGSFVFLTTIFNTLYHNILSLIIGKSFSGATLGYYIQAKKLQDTPRSSLSSVVTNVAFPVFAEIQDDRERLLRASEKSMATLLFVLVPVMFVLLISAYPLIDFLFTSKWEQSVPYFQILCVYGIFYTLNEFYRVITKAVGRSNLTLTIIVIQRMLCLLLVFIGLYWGMKGLLYGYIVSEVISSVISASIIAKLIKFKLLHQAKLLFPIFIISMVAAFLSYAVQYLPIEFNNLTLFLVECIIYTIIYIYLAWLFRINGSDYLFDFIHKLICKLYK